MRTINMTRIWPPPKYPLIHEARRIMKAGGIEALKHWAHGLTEEKKGELASQIIRLLSDATGRDPIDIAIELFTGKGEGLL